jgi:hypothetical protein
MALGSNQDFGSAGDFGPGIVDTGTSIAFIPTTPLNALATQIQASAGYKAVFGTQSLTTGMGCVTTSMTGKQIDAMLPPLHMAFPGANGGAASAFVDLPATHAYLLFMGPQAGWCFSMADSSQLGAPIAISLYGDTLLASFVTTFDIKNSEMRFAKQAGCAEAAIADVEHDTEAPSAGAQGIIYSPDRPWWQQDPRVRVPDPATLRAKLAPLFARP